MGYQPKSQFKKSMEAYTEAEAELATDRHHLRQAYQHAEKKVLFDKETGKIRHKFLRDGKTDSKGKKLSGADVRKEFYEAILDYHMGHIAESMKEKGSTLDLEKLTTKDKEGYVKGMMGLETDLVKRRMRSLKHKFTFETYNLNINRAIDALTPHRYGDAHDYLDKLDIDDQQKAIAKILEETGLKDHVTGIGTEEAKRIMELHGKLEGRQPSLEELIEAGIGEKVKDSYSKPSEEDKEEEK